MKCIGEDWVNDFGRICYILNFHCMRSFCQAPTSSLLYLWIHLIGAFTQITSIRP